MKSDLIMDVGLHVGDDTAFYLHRGYHVIAIEADPLVIKVCEKRFSRQIGEGMLTILNIGIGSRVGVMTFWRHEKMTPGVLLSRIQTGWTKIVKRLPSDVFHFNRC